MTDTRDTPEAAHRAEYDRALGGKSRARTLLGEHKDGIVKSALALAVRTAWGCDYPRSTGGHATCSVTDERIAAILAAIDVWALPSDDLLMVKAQEAAYEAEIERLTRELDAARTLAAKEYADAVPVDAERHEPGDPHQYRITCEVCGERGQIRLTVHPETSLAPAPSEPQEADHAL